MTDYDSISSIESFTHSTRLRFSGTIGAATAGTPSIGYYDTSTNKGAAFRTLSSVSYPKIYSLIDTRKKATTYDKGSTAVYEIKRELPNRYVRHAIDDNLQPLVTRYFYPTMPIVVQASNQPQVIDYLFVGKYISNEPVVSMSGSQQLISTTDSDYSRIAANSDMEMGTPEELEASILDMESKIGATENAKIEIEDSIVINEVIKATSSEEVLIAEEIESPDTSTTTSTTTSVVTDEKQEVVNIEAGTSTKPSEESILAEDIATSTDVVVVDEVLNQEDSNELKELDIENKSIEKEELIALNPSFKERTFPAKSYRYSELILPLLEETSQEEIRYRSLDNISKKEKQTQANVRSNLNKKEERVKQLQLQLAVNNKDEKVIEKFENAKREVQLHKEKLKTISDKLEKINKEKKTKKVKDNKSVKETKVPKKEKTSFIKNVQSILTQTYAYARGIFQTKEAIADTWADITYSNRVEIYLEGEQGAGTDYQVLLKVGKNDSVTGADFDLADKADFFPVTKNDGGDFVFYDNDNETKIPFWVEKVENDVAYVWVKVKDNLDIDREIYLYFGNDTPINYSNPNDTFIFHDDFTGTYNTLYWQNYGSYQINSGVFEMTTLTTSSGEFRTKSPKGGKGTAFIMRASVPSVSSGSAYVGPNNKKIYSYSTAPEFNVNGTHALNANTQDTFAMYDFAKIGDLDQRISINGDLEYQFDQNLGDKEYFYFYQRKVGKNSNMKIDWFAERKVNNVEPAFDTVGAIQNYTLVEPVDPVTAAMTVYEYDARDNLISVVDAEGNEREFAYDSLGRKISSELPHASTSTAATHTYTYDAVGNKTSETRPDGSVVNYTYDELNRVLTVDNPAEGTGSEVIYSYDSVTNGIGKLAGVLGDGYVKTYQYDVAGNMTTESVNVGGTLHTTTMSYSDYGLLESTTNPDGSVVTNSYYVTGDISGVDQNSNDVVDIDYNHMGQIVSQDYANGVEQEYSYDAEKEYRLVSKETKIGTSTLEDISYVYDNVGNVTEISNLGSEMPYTKEYEYDSVDRLVFATSTTVSSTDIDSYTYGKTGNILTHNADAYSYTNGKFPQAATSFAGNTYGYDANGNLSSKNDGSVMSTYTYDWNDRLSSVDQGSTNLGVYTYTDARQRLSKSVGTSTKYYINNNVEYDGDYTNHVFAGANRVLTSDTDGVHYTHKDHLQSTSLTTDQFGIVEEAVDYKAFGGERDRSGTHESDYTFTDQEYDNETALHYMNARYYDADLKRFTSVDAWSGDIKDPQTLNKFTYVNNNPLKYNDPSGNRLRAVGRDVQGMAGRGTHWFVRFDDNPQINNGRKTTIGGYTHDFIGGRLFREENYSTDYSLGEDEYTSSYDISAPTPYSQEGYEKMIYDKYMNSPKYEGDYHPDGGDIQYMESNSGNVFTQSMVDAGFSLDFINNTFDTPWSYDAGVGTLPNGADRQSNVSTQDGPILDKEEKPY